MSEIKKASKYSRSRYRNISIQKYLLKKIDLLVVEGKYISVPDFIRTAIRDYLARFHPEVMKNGAKKNGKDIISLEGLEDD
jgi:Arc/MetJ-type ribon-helix-helix transcriptional regulator